MATRAILASAPAGPGFVVGFVQPDQLILGDSVHTAKIEIEYATADAPSLAAGNALTIGATQYRVHNVPRKQGDGTFSRAELEEARA